MDIYPYNSAIILTDSIFVAYGGHTGSSTAAQRTAAYLIAEEVATDDLNAFLLPTRITGTYPYRPSALITDHAFVHSIDVVRFIDREETIYWATTGTSNIYVSLRDQDYGIVDIDYLLAGCNCHTHDSMTPYQVQVIYTSGLPTGVANSSKVLLALTTYADIILNEIQGYGNEAPGDIGVQSFSNQDYKETRVHLFRTSFGSSAKAHFASRLLTSLRKYRYVGL